ncbi:CA074 protein, partial [Urocolius indicus]|nr:CA074 protein [Urocolius indicus]
APRLVAAAREELGAGAGGRRRRRLAAARALQLAGEVLAVAAGLKPALLYDCGAAGLAELRRYLSRLGRAGLSLCPLHLLGAGSSALLLQPALVRRRLMDALRSSPAPFVDVSAGRQRPALCGTEDAEVIRGHLSALLAHLGTVEAAGTGSVSSSSEISPAGWNLCAVVGMLLGYPAAYSISSEEGADNCLALTPLRVFTVQASCPRIKDGLRVQIYSFSIPESLCAELQEVLDAWHGELQAAFSAQSDFVDLSVSSEVVTLPAVAL